MFFRSFCCYLLSLSRSRLVHATASKIFMFFASARSFCASSFTVFPLYGSIQSVAPTNILAVCLISSSLQTKFIAPNYIICQKIWKSSKHFHPKANAHCYARRWCGAFDFPCLRSVVSKCSRTFGELCRHLKVDHIRIIET